MPEFSDPIEYVGRNHSTKADPPKGKPIVKVNAATAPAVEIKPVSLGTESNPVETKPNTHLKYAVARPKAEYEAAQAEVRDAQAELFAARLALTEAEIVEAEALHRWLIIQPKIDPDALLRDYANRAIAERAANVSAGLPPEGIRPPQHNRSAIDVAAANRQRPNPQIATAPLRSPVARRVV